MGLLQVDKVIPQACKRRLVTIVTVPVEVLSDQVEHGGEGAEVVVLGDVELE